MEQGAGFTEQGARLAERWQQLGYTSHAAVSRASGIARATVAAAEAGTASHNTYVRLERWLAREEAALEPLPPVRPGDITFEVSGPGTDWRVRVTGPAEEADKLREQVVVLLREWQQQ